MVFGETQLTSFVPKQQWLIAHRWRHVEHDLGSRRNLTFTDSFWCRKMSNQTNLRDSRQGTKPTRPTALSSPRTSFGSFRKLRRRRRRASPSSIITENDGGDTQGLHRRRSQEKPNIYPSPTTQLKLTKPVLIDCEYE